MQISRSHVLGVGSLAMVFALTSCGDDAGGGGTGPGDTCTETDLEQDRKTCSGTRVLECKEGDWDGEQHWEVDEDCANQDKTCSDGECIESANNGNNGNTGDCPAVAGSWTFTQHCRAELIGQVYTVTQSGCTITIVEPGWSGSLTSSGGITMSGPAGPEAIWTCSGTTTTTRLVVDCAPENCHVEMSK